MKACKSWQWTTTGKVQDQVENKDGVMGAWQDLFCTPSMHAAEDRIVSSIGQILGESLFFGGRAQILPQNIALKYQPNIA